MSISIAGEGTQAAVAAGIHNARLKRTSIRARNDDVDSSKQRDAILCFNPSVWYSPPVVANLFVILAAVFLCTWHLHLHINDGLLTAAHAGLNVVSSRVYRFEGLISCKTFNQVLMCKLLVCVQKLPEHIYFAGAPVTT